MVELVIKIERGTKMEQTKEAIRTALAEAVDSTVEVVGDTLDFGFSITEAFPTESYKRVTINGKDYRLKMEISIKEIKW